MKHDSMTQQNAQVYGSQHLKKKYSIPLDSMLVQWFFAEFVAAKNGMKWPSVEGYIKYGIFLSKKDNQNETKRYKLGTKNDATKHCWPVDSHIE